MHKLKRAFKPFVIFLVILLLIQIISPLVPKTISAVESYTKRRVEVMEKGGFKVSNENYHDQNVKKVEIKPQPITESPYPLGTGVDPSDPQAAVNQVAEERDLKKEKLKKLELKERVKKEDAVAEIKDARTREFKTEDGFTIVEQSLGERFINKDGSFKEIDFKPKQTEDDKVKNESGKFSIDYDTTSKGITLDTGNGKINFKPVGALAAVKAEIMEDGQTVIYRNVWEGVDIEYNYIGN